MNGVLVALFYAKNRGGAKIDQSYLDYLSEETMEASNRSYLESVKDEGIRMRILAMQQATLLTKVPKSKEQ